MKYPKRSQYKHAKSPYRVRNWSEYEAGLRRRGDLTVWLSVDAAVLAVVERLNEPKLGTLDHRHFSVVRPRHVDALRLLPERG